MRIAIIEYGMGNIRSVQNAIALLGQECVIASEPKMLEGADAVILPGVGAFGMGMKKLRERKLIEPLNDLVINKKKPYLGICLGFQFLAKESCEYGRHLGLGWIDGSVVPMGFGNPALKVPHIGWNDIAIKRRSVLLEGFEKNPVFYFVHSFKVIVDYAENNIVTSTCKYGSDFIASIEKGNIYGVQFHPEKSQGAGLKLLNNFIKTSYAKASSYRLPPME